MFGILLYRLFAKSDKEQRSRRKKLKDGVDALIEHVPEDRLLRLKAFFAMLVEAIKAVGILVIAVVAVLFSLLLLSSGEHVLLVKIYATLATFGLTGWATVLVLKGEERKAALPVTILGGLAVAAFPVVILAGGYFGDSDRGYFLPLLTAATIVISMAWLYKRDKPVFALTGVVLAVLAFVELVLSIAASAPFIEQGAHVAALLFACVAGFGVLVATILGRSSGILIGLVPVFAYLSDWWLFGDPNGQSEFGWTIMLAGRLDQFWFGMTLLALALLLRHYQPSAEPEEPAEESAEEPDDPDPEDELWFEPPDEFVADLPPEVQAAWRRLTPEQREVVPDLLEWQLHEGPVVNGNDDYSHDLDPALRERAEAVGLEVDHYLYFGSRKAVTILAELADRRGVVPDDVWQQPGSEFRQRVGVMLGSLAERGGFALQDTQSSGIRHDILTELAISRDEVRDAQAHSAVPG